MKEEDTVYQKASKTTGSIEFTHWKMHTQSPFPKSRIKILLNILPS